MHERRRNRYGLWLAGLLSGILSLHCQAAGEQRPPIAIEAQRLDAALRAFAQQTELQLIYLTDLTRGLNTAGCGAVTSPADALAQLLTGTGLTFVFVNERTIQIQAAAPDGSRNVTQGGAAAAAAKSRRASVVDVPSAAEAGDS